MNTIHILYTLVLLFFPFQISSVLGKKKGKKITKQRNRDSPPVISNQHSSARSNNKSSGRSNSKSSTVPVSVSPTLPSPLGLEVNTYDVDGDPGSPNVVWYPQDPADTPLPVNDSLAAQTPQQIPPIMETLPSARSLLGKAPMDIPQSLDLSQLDPPPMEPSRMFPPQMNLDSSQMMTQPSIPPQMLNQLLMDPSLENQPMMDPSNLMNQPVFQPQIPIHPMQMNQPFMGHSQINPQMDPSQMMNDQPLPLQMPNQPLLDPPYMNQDPSLMNPIMDPSQMANRPGGYPTLMTNQPLMDPSQMNQLPVDQSQMNPPVMNLPQTFSQFQQPQYPLPYPLNPNQPLVPQPNMNSQPMYPPNYQPQNIMAPQAGVPNPPPPPPMPFDNSGMNFPGDGNLPPWQVQNPVQPNPPQMSYPMYLLNPNPMMQQGPGYPNAGMFPGNQQFTESADDGNYPYPPENFQYPNIQHGMDPQEQHFPFPHLFVSKKDSGESEEEEKDDSEDATTTSPVNEDKKSASAREWQPHGSTNTNPHSRRSQHLADSGYNPMPPPYRTHGGYGQPGFHPYPFGVVAPPPNMHQMKLQKGGGNALKIKAKCKPPLKPVNGQVRVGSRYGRGTAQYACHDGFSLKGIPIRHCLKGGSWSGKSPRCEYNKFSQQSSFNNLANLVLCCFVSFNTFSPCEGP